MEKKQQVVAKLNNLRITPRKVALVCDLVRGCTVMEARRRLAFTVKRSARPVANLVKAAASSAKVKGWDSEKMVLSEIMVGKGTTLKRIRAGSKGTARPILKRTTNIKLSLSVSDENGTKNKS